MYYTVIICDITNAIQHIAYRKQGRYIVTLVNIYLCIRIQYTICLCLRFVHKSRRRCLPQIIRPSNDTERAGCKVYDASQAIAYENDPKAFYQRRCFMCRPDSNQGRQVSQDAIVCRLRAPLQPCRYWLFRKSLQETLDDK